MTGRLHLPEGYSSSSQRHLGGNSALDTVTEENDSEPIEATGRVSKPPLTRNKNETAEEKKLRKAAVKLEKQENRATKKALKLSFVNEGKLCTKNASHQQSINNVSVFKYSM